MTPPTTASELRTHLQQSFGHPFAVLRNAQAGWPDPVLGACLDLHDSLAHAEHKHAQRAATGDTCRRTYDLLADRQALAAAADLLVQHVTHRRPSTMRISTSPAEHASCHKKPAEGRISASEAVLRDCQEIFKSLPDDKVLPSRILISLLREDLVHPWSKTGGADGLNAQVLAKLLVPHGIRPVCVTFDQRRAKGYRRSDFLSASHARPLATAGQRGETRAHGC